MTDEPFDAFQALVDLHSSWEEELERVRADAAGLLSDSRTARSTSPIADRQRRTRVIEAAERAAALNKCCQELAELLVLIEERRIAAYPQAHAGHPQPGSLPDHEGPQPF